MSDPAPPGALWSPASWRSKPALQQPRYPDEAALAGALARLERLPPLVTSWEVMSLRAQLAEAAQGARFVLQAGDCAERFGDCEAPRITAKLKVLLQMSLVLLQGSKKPVLRIGRFAGQYAKPRSEETEEQGGVSLPVYRGDLVNRPEFTAEARTPDPELLLRGYERAALTLNFIRALVKGGFADLHHPEYWDLAFLRHSPLAAQYERLVESIGESLRFMENVLGVRAGETDRIDFYTSHEALHLGYEQAQTRRVPHRPGWFNLAAHMPWIGLRTADLAGAHVEYCRGIENPVGVKVGPDFSPGKLLALATTLNPANEPGRLAFIHRYGNARVAEHLSRHLEAVKRAGLKVLWICDPMHGNTLRTAGGRKTRRFDDILRELDQAFAVHEASGAWLGGVHIELTGDPVTECTGGSKGPNDEDLGRAYETEVDPRLNAEQALEMALLIAARMQRSRPA